MIAIVDYEAGNLTSVKRALDFLNIPSIITPDPGKIRSADRVIFPGVGHAASAMNTLMQRGLDAALKMCGYSDSGYLSGNSNYPFSFR